MSHINLEELKAMNELADALTIANVNLLQEILSIPPAIVETTETHPIDFLNALKFDITDFDPSQFIDALKTIKRPELILLAKKITWVGSAKLKKTTTPFETFVTMLRREVKADQWKAIIGSGLSERVSPEIDFDTAFKRCIEGNVVEPDLEELCDIMLAISRNDIVQNIQKYSNLFHGMNRQEFRNKLIDELDSDGKEESVQWCEYLRAYAKQQNKKVSIMFDEEETVLLEDVYTPLTVVKEEVMFVKFQGDTTLNEIAFLKSMSDNMKRLETVDFIELVSELIATEPEVLALVGNPGSGKTFLCKYIAFLYGTCKLNNLKYVVSVPCRNEEWHQMETARQENESEIDEEFVRKWLLLGMPMSISWSKSLSKHLAKSGGDSLLLIIDGVDEFIKDVPFQTTLLYFLLRKRIMTRASILITSRPEAWNDIRNEHAQELKVDTNYQVLGFSPSDRDSYFQKRISTEAKLTDTKELFFRHDEINQLSLVPVNASLFTSLFNATNNILSQTLTELYSALIVYIIRRQLYRMGLKKLARVERLAQFNPTIQKCIGRIGEEAYEGIYHRELNCREEDISIRVDASNYKTERLGLMQVQVRVSQLGQRVNVWTFAHLTLQEYMAAVSLSNKKWHQQCIITRYIVSSEEMVAMYQMVVRFLCGLLSDRAACLIPILCRHIIPDTMAMDGIPMVHQLYYLGNLTEVSDWNKFTEQYLLVCTIIAETNCQLVERYFECLRSQLPEHLYFYFYNSISPNEFHCFIQSLKYICRMEILFIRTSLINPFQFRSLLRQLSSPSCCLRYLAIAFFGDDTEPIQSYTSLLVSPDITIRYKLSISLVECELTESQPSSPLFPTTNDKWTGSIMFDESIISHEILSHLTEQFRCIENILYEPKSDDSDWSVLYPLINNNRLIKGLHIRDPNSYLPITPDLLSGLSSLEELSWYQEDAYTALPHIQTANSLSYLELYSPRHPPVRENYQHQLRELINNNSTTLRDIRLDRLHRLGMNSWASILSALQSCCNLVSLGLSNSPFSSDDISCWATAILSLQSLVELALIAIPLRDIGLMSLCKSLYRHPVIRRLRITECELTSDSCEPIQMLIHTLPYLRLLKLHKPELSLPNASPLQQLLHTADLFYVKVEFL